MDEPGRIVQLFTSRNFSNSIKRDTEDIINLHVFRKLASTFEIYYCLFQVFRNLIIGINSSNVK